MISRGLNEEHPNQRYFSGDAHSGWGRFVQLRDVYKVPFRGSLLAFLSKRDFRTVSVIARPASVSHPLFGDSSTDGGDSFIDGHFDDVFSRWYPPPFSTDMGFRHMPTFVCLTDGLAVYSGIRNSGTRCGILCPVRHRVTSGLVILLSGIGMKDVRLYVIKFVLMYIIWRVVELAFVMR